MNHFLAEALAFGKGSMKLLALLMLAAVAFAQPYTAPSYRPDRSREAWSVQDFRYALPLFRGQRGLAPGLPMRGHSTEGTIEGGPIQSALVGRFNSPAAPPVAARSFFRSRKFLFLLGGAIAGTGAALLATGERSRQVPATNCSFYPAPFVPCISAHSEKTRSGVRDGFGGGMLMGGFVVVWVAIAR